VKESFTYLFVVPTEEKHDGGEVGEVRLKAGGGRGRRGESAFDELVENGRGPFELTVRGT